MFSSVRLANPTELLLLSAVVAKVMVTVAPLLGSTTRMERPLECGSTDTFQSRGLYKAKLKSGLRYSSHGVGPAQTTGADKQNNKNAPNRRCMANIIGGASQAGYDPGQMNLRAQVSDDLIPACVEGKGGLTVSPFFDVQVGLDLKTVSPWMLTVVLLSHHRLGDGLLHLFCGRL